MDVRYINPFVSAIRNVFKTMMGVEVNVGKPFVKKMDSQAADVSAVIGYSGDATGCVIISFPMAAAVTTASKFAGTALDQSHPDFADALGELANMIAGNAKAQFDGFDVKISLPSVIVGQGHKVSPSHAIPRLVIPCECSIGNFAVEIGMKLEKSARVSAASAAPAAAGV